MNASCTVRPFHHDDVPQLTRLMRELAVFEDYIDEFAITEVAVIDAGLRSVPAFGALVADNGAGSLLGMAVHYRVPWTYDLRPILILKELFVTADARGRGVGTALMAGLVAEGRRIGASRINWTVMTGNDPAGAFYHGLDARPDLKWQPWSLRLESGPGGAMSRESL